MARRKVVRQTRIPRAQVVSSPDRVQELRNKGYTQSGNILSSPKESFLATFDPDPNFRKTSTFSSHVLELDSQGRIKREVRQRPRITSTAGRSSFRRIIPFEIKLFDFGKGILTTTRPGTTFRTTRHIESALRKSVKVPVVTKVRGGGTSIKVPIGGGRTQTVSSTGRVTIRDSRGRIEKNGVFQTDVDKAKAFITSTSSAIRKRLADEIRFKKETAKNKKAITAFFGDSKANINALSKRFGVSTILPTIKVFRNSKGKIVGIRDNVAKKSLRVDPETSSLQIAVTEGLREAKKLVDKHNKKVEADIAKREALLKEKSIKGAVARTTLAAFELRERNVFTRAQAKKALDDFTVAQRDLIKDIEKRTGKKIKPVLLADLQEPGREVVRAEFGISNLVKEALKAGVSPSKIKVFNALSGNAVRAQVSLVKVVPASVLVGIVSTGLVLVATVKDPIGMAKQQFKAVTQPAKTLKLLKEEFNKDPVQIATEFWTFGKILNLAGVGLKKLPISRFLAEEWLILKQPANIRPFYRQIFKSQKWQEKLNPSKVKSLSKADIVGVEKLTAVEAKALLATVKELSNSTVKIGPSFMKKVLGKLAPDITLATENIAVFNKRFISNLPKNIRKNYVIRGGRVVRKATNTAVTKQIPTNIITRNLGRVKIKVKVKLKPEVKLKLSAAKARIVKKVTKPISRVGRKIKRITRVGAEKISVVNSRVLTSIRSSMGDVGITVRFAKFRVSKRIGEISAPAIKSINGKIRLLKRNIKKAGGLITNTVLKQINSLKNALKTFNIKLSFAKYKLGQRLTGLTKKVSKVGRKVKRIVRVGGEALNKTNQRVLNKISSGLGDLNINVRFAKFRVNQRIKTISGSIERLIDRRIRLIKSGLVKTKGKITKTILKQINSLKTSLKNFNIKITFTKFKVSKKASIIRETVKKRGAKITRPARRIIRVSGETLNRVNQRAINGIKNNLASVGIRVKFAKFRVNQKIGNISSSVNKLVDKRVRFIKRSLKASKSKITKPILNQINALKTSLKTINIKITFAKFRIGQEIRGLTETIGRGAVKVRRGVRRKIGAVNRKVVGEINKINVEFRNIGLRARFKVKSLRESLAGLSEPALRTLDKRIRGLRRSLKKTKGKINKATKSIIKSIDSIIPFQVTVKIKQTFPKTPITTRSGKPTKSRVIIKRVARNKVGANRINRLKLIKALSEAKNLKGMSRFELNAFAKTLQQERVIIFGSLGAKIIGGKKAPIPKDIDFAVTNQARFIRRFKKNLPPRLRSRYSLDAAKITRNGVLIADIKLISALRTELPFPGFTLPKPSITKKGLSIKRGVQESAILLPKQKLQKFGGVKIIGFGEQTVRKGMGTIKTLVLEDVRRAKDPAAFITGLRIQASALRRKPNPINLARAARLEIAVKILNSDAFIKLLESKLPSRARFVRETFKELNKIDTKKLKNININRINTNVRQVNNRLKALEDELSGIRKVKPKNNVEANRLRKQRVKIEAEIKRFTTSSKLLPSRLPKSFKSVLPSVIKPSRVPSKVSGVSKVSRVSRVSRLPSRIPSSSFFRSSVPSGVGSVLTSIIPSGVPSRPPSGVPSRPPSGIPSKLVSKIPSRITLRRVPSKLPPPLPIKKQFEKLKVLVDKSVKGEKLIFIPDLFSVVYGVRASAGEKKAFLRAGRLFTGFERRKLVKR